MYLTMLCLITAKVANLSNMILHLEHVHRPNACPTSKLWQICSKLVSMFNCWAGSNGHCLLPAAIPPGVQRLAPLVDIPIATPPIACNLHMWENSAALTSNTGAGCTSIAGRQDWCTTGQCADVLKPKWTQEQKCRQGRSHCSQALKGSGWMNVLCHLNTEKQPASSLQAKALCGGM